MPPRRQRRDVAAIFKSYMKQKPLIAIIVVFVLASIILMIWSMQKTKEQHDTIREDFDSLKNSLRHTNDSLVSANDSLLLNLKKKLSK